MFESEKRNEQFSVMLVVNLKPTTKSPQPKDQNDEVFVFTVVFRGELANIIRAMLVVVV